MTRKTRIQPMIPPAATRNDDHEPRSHERPSKSQLKREMHALQALGVELIALPKDTLARIPLPESLAAALYEARRITDHEGKRRQIQYVGRVMRTLTEEEIAILRNALGAYHGNNRAETARLHWIERTREMLLADDKALTTFLHTYPDADAQTGRTLIRNARKEMQQPQQQQKPPRHFRELFQWIKAASAEESSSTRADHVSSTAHAMSEERHNAPHTR